MVSTKRTIKGLILNANSKTIFYQNVRKTLDQT